VRKRKALVAGQSVALTEDELNLAFDAPTRTSPRHLRRRRKGKAPLRCRRAGPGRTGRQWRAADRGAPNFRFLKDGELQIGIPCTINVNMLSYSQT